MSENLIKYELKKTEENKELESLLIEIVTANQFFATYDQNKMKKQYMKSMTNTHDEPWVTLMSLYALFGDGSIIKDDPKNRFYCDRLVKILESSSMDTKVTCKKLKKVVVEKRLPEIQSYRAYFNLMNNKGAMHFYPDRLGTLFTKRSGNQSIEGNTNLDAMIEFVDDEDERHVIFIEAKFLSDISYMTTYNPVRNQIVRNIDAMIDYQGGESDEKSKIEIKNKHFLLLTPKVFRTELFGCNRISPLESYNPAASRLYCFIMDRYKSNNGKLLAEDLPSRTGEVDFGVLSKNIGWITFEDIYGIARGSECKSVKNFFAFRNLVE